MRSPSRWPSASVLPVLFVLTLASPPRARAQVELPFGATVTSVVPSDQPARFAVDAAEAGFLSVVVRSLDDLDVSLTVMDPDGRPSDAIELAVGEDHEDVLSPDDTRDWYRIVPTTDGVLTILTRSSSGDLVLEVYAEGAYVEPMERSDQDQNGVSGNEAVTLDVTAGTPLFVRVLPFMGTNESIDYRIASGLVGD